jgi:two-component system, sensor histidine kinase
MQPVVVALIQRYGFALFCTTLATLLRLQLGPILGDRIPFGLYYLSVLGTAWVAGTGPAIAALMGGILAAIHWIVPPDRSWDLPEPADQLALALYGIVGIAGILLFQQKTEESAMLQSRASENEELSGRLSEADRRKDEFLALLAHELRNPLAPIRTGLAILDQERGLSEAGTEVRDVIRRQVDQLVRLVDDLFDVSRFMRGQLRMTPSRIDLRHVVDLALHTVQPQVEVHQHDLQFLRPQQAVYVLGDEVRLTQVVANLLTNAVRYTPRSGRIRILLDSVDGEVCLQVCDNGIGIPQDAQSHIFDPFSLGNPTHTRDHGGLGLGLAIVRQIIEMHAGTVTVASDGPGRGSCFAVRLALAPENVAAAELSPTHELAIRADAAPGKRVMIVDDNQDAAETLSMLLSYDGYATHVANDGHAALKSYEQFEPDVILLDIGMPGMDGYEVARRLRRNNIGLRSTIIAVTGWGQESDRILSRNAGIDHHLVKPVSLPRLLSLIASAGSDAAALADRETRVG